jgi:putative transferase (TIGR04331 family)
MRSKLDSLSLGDNEFEKIIAKMLPLDVPQSYIESYALIKNFSLKKYPQRVKAILTANAWYYDEAFKQWSASAAERGVVLLGAQHGGNYGSADLFLFAENEIEITDRFYSWGWEHPAYERKVIPMPAPYLLYSKIHRVHDKKEGVLFGTGLSPNYFIGFPYLPIYFEDYLKWQIRFLKTLIPELRAGMRVRLHAEEWGWDIAERIKTNFPEILLENWDDGSFASALNNCRLYVCDNLLTTFLEALSANKPTILFWNPKTNILRPEAEPYYEILKESGILYHNPEEAAGVVNSVYESTEKWWDDTERQLARRKFCNRFAKTSHDSIKKWLGEFKYLAERNCVQN